MMLMVSLGALCGCGSTAAPPSEKAEKTLPKLQAVVLEVEEQSWPMIVRSQGSLVADEVAVVGARVAGRVAQVHVDLGDVVRESAPLVTLEQHEFRLQVEQAEAQLAQARSAVGLRPGDPVSDLNPENAPPVRQERAIWDEAKSNLTRAKRLRQENAVSQAEFDQIASAERVAEAKYSSALNGVHEKIALISVREAELSLAKQRLQDATIRTPFDGLVLQRNVAPGAYVHVGDQIATVVRSNPLRFRGLIPERHAQRLALGQTVRLKVESIPEPLTVKVTRISPSLDQMNRSLLFEAEVENRQGRLRTGLFAEAEIVIDPSARSIVVPASAVVEFAGAEKVWKVVDGVATEQEVLTGQRRATGIEILKGIESGDVILRNGNEGQVALIEPIQSLPNYSGESGTETATGPKVAADRPEEQDSDQPLLAQPAGLSE